ncbi:N-acetyltransferase [Actinorhabdospora filicis]|uniref:N-acetyltransferase n=1 Tax=Actinorhabdospora filicis TaxID=1785913 RepID=A0A9W6SQW1_9ACTN|nr:GNAT family N-acetyltransferase [Actinorhabdospora filicis]GLZ81284.1 N-acetyltransferase [Actinorhabdospora filicis]
MALRESTPADLPAMAEIWTEVYPHLITTPESLAARDAPGRRLYRLVWEEDGEILATGGAGLDTHISTPDAWYQFILVAPAHQKKGIGTAFQETIDAHLREVGAAQVSVRSIWEHGFAFAEKTGFAHTRTERISRLDLAGLPQTPELPEGVTVQSINEIDLRLAYEMELATVNDVPGDDPWKVPPFEEWVKDFDEPRFDKDASILLVEDGRAIALAYLDRGDVRVWSGYTAVHPDARGRGLGRLAKLVALNRAKASGATTAFTNNDATNAPMLAVNVGLGYRPHFEQRAYLRRL